MRSYAGILLLVGAACAAEPEETPRTEALEQIPGPAGAPLPADTGLVQMGPASLDSPSVLRPEEVPGSGEDTLRVPGSRY